MAKEGIEASCTHDENDRRRNQIKLLLKCTWPQKELYQVADAKHMTRKEVKKDPWILKSSSVPDAHDCKKNLIKLHKQCHDYRRNQIKLRTRVHGNRRIKLSCAHDAHDNRTNQIKFITRYHDFRRNQIKLRARCTILQRELNQVAHTIHMTSERTKSRCPRDAYVYRRNQIKLHTRANNYRRNQIKLHTRWTWLQEESNQVADPCSEGN